MEEDQAEVPDGIVDDHITLGVIEVESLPDPDDASGATDPPPGPGNAAAAAVARAWSKSDCGYISGVSRPSPIGQVTVWARSISARCMMHKNCRRAHTFAALQSGNALAEWLVDGLAFDDDGGRDHMGLPKPALPG